MSAINLTSLADTEAFAKRVARRLRKGDVVTLAGDLGAGKTTFAQFLIQALSPAPVEVTSPTFTLLQTYPIEAQNVACELYHYDLYRIEHEVALEELGFDEALQNISLIEWPQRLGRYPMPVSLALYFTLAEDGSRSVNVTPHAAHMKDIE